MVLLHILQSHGQLHWSTGSGRQSEKEPLTTEPEVRAELCMPLSGEYEGRRRREGKGRISHTKVFMSRSLRPNPDYLEQVHDCMIVFLMYNALMNEVGPQTIRHCRH